MPSLLTTLLNLLKTLVKSILRHLTPTPPPPIYNEPLEIAHSRIHRALTTTNISPSRLLASIEQNLSSPWVEAPPAWRIRETVKSAQLRRRERRARIWGVITPKDKERTMRIQAKKDVKSMEKLTQEKLHRKEVTRKIWQYEIAILKGTVKEKEKHPGILKEAERRYLNLKFEMLIHKLSPEELEDSIRENMEEEVDAGRELGIEWEILRVVLELFLGGLDGELEKVEARKLKFVEGEGLKLGGGDDVSRDQACRSIFKRLFVEDLVLSVGEWEERLRKQVSYFKGLRKEGKFRLEETKAIVGELERVREEGRFPSDFMHKYGQGVVTGLRLSERDKIKIGWEMVRRRNTNI